jgi:hypothetical protein
VGFQIDAAESSQGLGQKRLESLHARVLRCQIRDEHSQGFGVNKAEYDGL